MLRRKAAPTESEFRSRIDHAVDEALELMSLSFDSNGAAVNGIVRGLEGALPAPQAAFIRFAFGLVFLGPMLVGALRMGFPPGSGSC